MTQVKGLQYNRYLKDCLINCTYLFIHRLASKSGLSMIHQVHVGAGIIDPDYTGEVKVLLINAASCYHYIKRGDPMV